MEKLPEDNMYVIDLGNVNNAPEMIFELSSILDNDEAKNKRICLKLGNADLNQAQLLSIKSLINGVDSILSCLDTKSVATEKVALSLGIIVSNVSRENAFEIANAMPYKTAEEFKEEIQNMQAEEQSSSSCSDKTEQELGLINENDVSAKTEENTNSPANNENSVHIAEENEYEAQNQIKDAWDSDKEENSENLSAAIQETQQDEEIKDELDVIFGSEPLKTNIFEMAQPQEEHYEERESLTDIIVPEEEYTKEDIELEEFPTKYIKQTIRSGQVINYEGNIVIIGDCHPGCEVTALGDITVWGILSGIAHAGSGGNQKARVRALKMNAIQLRIANCYSRRPDSLNTVYVEKTNSFTPEEARIVNSEIIVFKIND